MLVRAGAAPHAIPAIEHLAGTEAVPPRGLDPFAVVRVDGLQPALGLVLLGALAGDPAPLGRVLGHLAIWLGDPDDLGACLHERPVPLLAAPQRLSRLVLLGDIDSDDRDAVDVALAVMGREPGKRPLPDRRLGLGLSRACGGRAGDRVLGARCRVVACLHPADRGFGGRREVNRPHLRGRLAHVGIAGCVAQPGHCLVHPQKAQVRTDKGEPDRCLGEKRLQQRRVRYVKSGDPRPGHRRAGAHREHPAFCRWLAIEQLPPAHCGHKKATGNIACRQEGRHNSAARAQGPRY